MNADQTVRWLNERTPFAGEEWLVGDDVFCLHCDGVFKAEDVAQAHDGIPICPVCHDGTPIDFHRLPWWRDDLINQRATKDRIINTWRLKPIHAVPGEPGRLPQTESYEAN